MDKPFYELRYNKKTNKFEVRYNKSKKLISSHSNESDAIRAVQQLCENDGWNAANRD